MSRRLSFATEQSVISQYLSGLGFCQLANLHQCGITTVGRVLARNNIAIRPSHVRNRQTSLDAHYFANISTEEKAYWLGFITADGGLSSRQNNVRINLSNVDHLHLEKFRTAIGYSVPVKRYRKMSYVSVTSKEFFDDLLKTGLTPKKSLNCVPWDGPYELMPHYWRGVFDGDGCISISRQPKPPYPPWWEFNLCGSRLIMESFALFCQFRIRWFPNIFEKHKIWYARCGGVGKPQSVLKLLFHNATVWLDRKKTIVDKCLSQPTLHYKWKQD